jgi:hypothetical protein
LELFQRGDTNLEVAKKLGLSYAETIEEKKQYMQLIGADKFGEFYDEMKGDLESHILLNEELKCANVSATESIKGIIYARQRDQIKFEINGLQNNLQQLRQDIYVGLQMLKALNVEKNSLTSQVEALKEGKNAVSNEIETILPNQEMPPTVRISKRQIRHTQAFDMFQEHEFMIDVDSKVE